MRYVTGLLPRGRESNLTGWQWLTPETTLVFYKGHAAALHIARELTAHGMSSDTPVLHKSSGTTLQERRIFTRLDRLTSDLQRANLPGPLADHDRPGDRRSVRGRQIGEKMVFPRRRYRVELAVVGAILWASTAAASLIAPASPISSFRIAAPCHG